MFKLLYENITTFFNYSKFRLNTKSKQLQYYNSERLEQSIGSLWRTTTISGITKA